MIAIRCNDIRWIWHIRTVVVFFNVFDLFKKIRKRIHLNLSETIDNSSPWIVQFVELHSWFFVNSFVIIVLFSERKDTTESVSQMNLSNWFFHCYLCRINFEKKNKIIRMLIIWYLDIVLHPNICFHLVLKIVGPWRNIFSMKIMSIFFDLNQTKTFFKYFYIHIWSYWKIELFI